MVILDTNVISEFVKAAPNPHVAAWAENQPRGSLFVTSVTQAEVFFGLALLPDGQRKTRLIETHRDIFFMDFAGQILSFDSGAASAYANIAAHRRKVGRPIGQFDAQIAAIARSRGAAVATRNVTDFTGCGVDIINPWEAR